MPVDAPAVDENESHSSEDELGIFGLYAMNRNKVGRGYHVEVAVNGESISMEIERAADYLLMKQVRLICVLTPTRDCTPTKNCLME